MDMVVLYRHAHTCPPNAAEAEGDPRDACGRLMVIPEGIFCPAAAMAATAAREDEELFGLAGVIVTPLVALPANIALVSIITTFSFADC